MSASDTSSIFDFLPDSLSAAAVPPARGRIVSMRAQYVTDLSFELRQPLFDRSRAIAARMGVFVAAESHAPDMHEVRLSLKVDGMIDDAVVVAAELVYGGLVWTEGAFGGDELAVTLRVDAADLLFPMAKQILVDYLAQAGCPAPIPTPNFHELYDRHRAGGDTAV